MNQFGFCVKFQDQHATLVEAPYLGTTVTKTWWRGYVLTDLNTVLRLAEMKFTTPKQMLIIQVTVPKYLSKVALWTGSVPSQVLGVGNKAALLRRARMYVVTDTCVMRGKARWLTLWLFCLQLC